MEKSSENQISRPLFESSKITQAERNLCEKAAAQLLGCFRTIEVNDAEIFLAATVAVLCKYGSEIAFAIADPITGLPSRLKFFPTIAELTSACDAELYLRRAQETVAAWESTPPPQAPKMVSRPLMTNVDPCNLLVRRGRRGFQEMIDAHAADKAKHLRWDTTGIDGIHVNYGEFAAIVGLLRQAS